MFPSVNFNINSFSTSLNDVNLQTHFMFTLNPSFPSKWWNSGPISSSGLLDEFPAKIRKFDWWVNGFLGFIAPLVLLTQLTEFGLDELSGNVDVVSGEWWRSKVGGECFKQKKYQTQETWNRRNIKQYETESEKQRERESWPSDSCLWGYSPLSTRFLLFPLSRCPEWLTRFVFIFNWI